MVIQYLLDMDKSFRVFSGSLVARDDAASGFPTVSGPILCRPKILLMQIIDKFSSRNVSMRDIPCSARNNGAHLQTIEGGVVQNVAR